MCLSLHPFFLSRAQVVEEFTVLPLHSESLQSYWSFPFSFSHSTKEEREGDYMFRMNFDFYLDCSRRKFCSHLLLAHCREEERKFHVHNIFSSNFFQFKLSPTLKSWHFLSFRIWIFALPPLSTSLHLRVSPLIPNLEQRVSLGVWVCGTSANRTVRNGMKYGNYHLTPRNSQWIKHFGLLYSRKRWHMFSLRFLHFIYWTRRV